MNTDDSARPEAAGPPASSGGPPEPAEAAAAVPSRAPRSPPVAARRPHPVASPHGTRIDPYYWLRDDSRESPEVLAYLKAENEYRAQSMASTEGLEQRLYEEFIARLKQDDASVPYLKGGYWYYSRYETGREHPIFARRLGSLESPEEVLLDGNERARGHEFYQVGGLEVSRGARWLAFCEDTVGRREYTLRFKDLTSGQILPEAIERVESDVAWANDERTVFYVEKDPETLLGLFVKKHTLRIDPKDDATVFTQHDRSMYTGVSKSKSERFVFLHMESTVASEWWYAEADDPALAFKVVRPARRDHEYQVEHVRDSFLIRTNAQARNFRLVRVAIDEASDETRWTDLVPHRPDTFLGDFDPFERFVALTVRTGGLKRIRIVPLPGTEGAGALRPHDIASDEAAYAMSLSVNCELATEHVRYAHHTLTTPTSIYDYNVLTGERRLLKRDPVLGSFDPAHYASEFLFAPARDGVLVPVSLLYRRSTFKRNGSAPLLQYAYGAYGISMDPSFSPLRLSLLDRGFVFALAHVRGGQEMGRAWYDSGRLLSKKNSFHDFIDVTRDLVARGYADPRKVFAMGGSAGGLLVGTVANWAPHDYRGLIAQVPFVDVVTTMLDESVPLTTNEYDEWGDPREQRYYEYMLSYSPYDNVSVQSYPAMLVTTGLWDSQVQYYEPAKWVAKLRAMKTDANRLLLHVDLDAGHGGKSGRFQRYREIAMEYAFMLGELGIND
ncbi:MAG TPA: S9 family peptidase [Steroidobacteraceae bacterium]|nr:S9 family peptidase [Steroidobacteraceae bacterium]